MGVVKVLITKRSFLKKGEDISERKWGVLKQNKVETIEELAEMFLPTLDGLNVVEQFKKQNVDRIFKRPLLIPGGMFIEKEVQRFVIVLSKDHPLDVFTLGHELGHTFGSEKRKGQLVRSWRNGRCLEDFCEVFAAKWLKRNNNEEQMLNLLTENLTEDTILFFSPIKEMLGNFTP